MALVTTHTNSHAFFYPGLEIAAGLPADLDVIRGLSVAMANATNNGYTNVRDSAHDYETSGETIDWSYYATRGFAVTPEVVGGSCIVLRRAYADQQGHAGAELAQLHRRRLHRHAAARRRPRTRSPPTAATRSATRSTSRSSYATLAERPLRDHRHGPGGRDAEDHQGLQPLHEPGAAADDAGRRRRRRRRSRRTSSPRSRCPPPASFSWNVNPSVRPVPPYRAEGMVPGPNGFLQESWTLTCTLPDGTVAGDQHDHDRQGPDGRRVALHAGRRRRHRAGDAGADAGRSGHVRRVHAGRGERVHGVDDGDRDLDRG